MKNLIGKLNIKNNLLIVIYALTIIMFLLNGLFNFISDIIINHEEKELLITDFELNELIVNEDYSLTAIGYDAQMIYKSDEEIKSVYYLLENTATGVVCSYYIGNENQGFSNHNRLFPKFSVNNEALYIYPNNTKIIRLDIGSEYGENYVFKEITLNKDIPFLNYFSINAWQFVLIVFIPLLVYSVIKFILLIYYSFKNNNSYQ